MQYIHPFNELTSQIDPDLAWVNEGVASGVEGSIPPARFFHDLQMEILHVIQQSGLTPDEGDLTQLYQAILLLTRVTADEGQSAGYRDIYVPGDYPTIQAAIDFIAPLAIPRDLTVRIFVAPGFYEVNLTTGPIVFDHPNGNRVQLIGQGFGTFPTAAAVNLSDAASTLGVLQTVWPVRIRVTGGVRAGLFVRDGSLGLIENFLFQGDGSAGSHGLLYGDWDNGHGRSGGGIKNCWFHQFGVDGLRINYNSEVTAHNIGASWCGEQGIRVVNQSSLQSTGMTVVVRNVQAGLLAGDMSFFEQISSGGGKIDARNNGLNGIVAFNLSEVALGSAPNSQGNTGYGYNASNDGWMYTTAGNVTASGNSLGALGAFVQGKMQITGAAGLGLTSSPSLNTLGNNNSYIMG